jgi:hypothetical protein
MLLSGNQALLPLLPATSHPQHWLQTHARHNHQAQMHMRALCDTVPQGGLPPPPATYSTSKSCRGRTSQICPTHSC